jgi:hypothetical protein
VEDDDVRMPGPDSRLAMIGRTGSGKTQAALWHLSRADFEERPWVILDYKREKLFGKIQRAESIDLDEVPDEAGIYILRIRPDKKKQMTDWFRRAWEHENIGILVDEGYMIDQHDEWFVACLTQGRSKRIQMIVLSQRPVWVSRFVFSEADFFQIFDLSHSEDKDKLGEYIRDEDQAELDEPLKDYNSFYYDVGRRRLETFGKVDREDVILAAIDTKLKAIEAEEEHRSVRRAL